MEYFEKLVNNIYKNVDRDNIDGAIVVLAAAILDSIHDTSIQQTAQEIITNELQ